MNIESKFSHRFAQQDFSMSKKDLEAGELFNQLYYVQGEFNKIIHIPFTDKYFASPRPDFSQEVLSKHQMYLSNTLDEITEIHAKLKEVVGELKEKLKDDPPECLGEMVTKRKEMTTTKIKFQKMVRTLIKALPMLYREEINKTQ